MIGDVGSSPGEVKHGWEKGEVWGSECALVQPKTGFATKVLRSC